MYVNININNRIIEIKNYLINFYENENKYNNF